jgi:hypothetical protein
MPSKKRHPAGKAVSTTTKRIDRLAAEYQAEVEAGLARGLSAAVATREAFRATKYADAVVKIIGNGIKDGLKTTGVSYEASFRRTSALDKVFDGVTLSDRIVTSAVEGNAAVSSAISATLRDGKAWTKVALEVRRTGYIGSDPTKLLSSLKDASSRAFGGTDPKALRAYQSEIGKLTRHISRLKDSNAPTGQLRKAYEKVISASESGSQTALQAALDNAIAKKMAYNAQRIARTEIIRAYGEEKMAEFKADPDVVAIKWTLTSSDNACPICTALSEEDSGYGPGVYLLDNVPDYPQHPNDMCDLVAVYIDELPEKT